MNIVVDTNIVFSALMGAGSTIPELIIAPFGSSQFYTSEVLFEELDRHKDKLQKLSRLTEREIDRAKTELFKYITVISLDIIPQAAWREAEYLTMDIDPDDIPFVALSIFLNAHLWTGDKALYNGLLRNGFDKALLTSQLKVML
jgi:predicted nucleic acid-binding protein